MLDDRSFLSMIIQKTKHFTKKYYDILNVIHIYVHRGILKYHDENINLRKRGSLLYKNIQKGFFMSSDYHKRIWKELSGF